MKGKITTLITEYKEKMPSTLTTGSKIINETNQTDSKTSKENAISVDCYWGIRLWRKHRQT